jgi:hypothetical protein
MKMLSWWNRPGLLLQSTVLFTGMSHQQVLVHCSQFKITQPCVIHRSLPVHTISYFNYRSRSVPHEPDVPHLACAPGIDRWQLANGKCFPSICIQCRCNVVTITSDDLLYLSIDTQTRLCCCKVARTNKERSQVTVQLLSWMKCHPARLLSSTTQRRGPISQEYCLAVGIHSALKQWRR